MEEEEEGGLIVEGDDVNESGQGNIDFWFCVVGKFLTNKVINFPIMKNTMASLWRLGKGVYINDLSHTLFLFQFFYKVDMKRVFESGPWTFDQHILNNLRMSYFALLRFGSRFEIYNLPIGFMFEKILKDIGNYISTPLWSLMNII